MSHTIKDASVWEAIDVILFLGEDALYALMTLGPGDCNRYKDSRKATMMQVVI